MIKKIVYIGCRVSEDFRESFNKLAQKNNTTSSKILRKLMKKYMRDNNGKEK